MSSLSSPSSTDSLFYSAPPSPPDGPFPTANDKHDVAGLGGPRGIKAYLRFANTVFVKGSLVTAAGLTLPVQLNSTALGVESAGLATWVVDGGVSVAAVPCDKCRALEYHRPEGNRPLPCLVRSASKRSDGENCALCKVKRQSCCAELRTPNAQEGEERPVMRRSARTEAARATQRLEEERQVAAVHKDAQRVAQAMEAWVAKVTALPPARQSVLVDEVRKCGLGGSCPCSISLSSPDGRHYPPYPTTLGPSPPANLYAKAEQPSSRPPFLV